MTEREIRRDLVVGFLTFLVIVIGGLGLFVSHKADRLEADRDNWKHTASVLEGRWLEAKDRADEWEKQSNELPPFGTAEPERGE